MAIGDKFLTLQDIGTSLDPDNTIARAVMMLGKVNSILKDAPFRESNLPTGHQVTQNVALASGQFRGINQYVPSGKSSELQRTFGIGLYTAFSEIDPKMPTGRSSMAELRASKDLGFVEGISQAIATNMLYGDVATTPEGMQGLMTFYSNSAAQYYGSQVVKVGTQSGADQSSILVIGWATDKVYMVYPMHSTSAGLEKIDRGAQVFKDVNGNNATRLVTEWNWNLGLAIEDPRYVARVQWDTSAESPTGRTLVDALTKATHRIFDLDNCAPVIYMNRATREFLDLQAQSNALRVFNDMNWHGSMVQSFRGIPIRLAEAMTSTESPVA